MLQLLTLALTGGPSLAGGAGGAGGGLTTAAIDYSLYREGEVRRTETLFKRWLLTCDAIPKLGQKFCSMKSVARAADGTTVAAVTVSTDDRGRPAAILTLPYGTTIGAGVAISYAPPAKKRAKAEGPTLRPSQCGGLGCQIVWPMGPGDIAELRGTDALRLSFRMVPGRPSLAAFLAPLPTAAIVGRVDMAGFSDALDASMH